MPLSAFEDSYGKPIYYNTRYVPYTDGPGGTLCTCNLPTDTVMMCCVYPISKGVAKGVGGPASGGPG